VDSASASTGPCSGYQVSSSSKRDCAQLGGENSDTRDSSVVLDFGIEVAYPPVLYFVDFGTGDRWVGSPSADVVGIDY
jgi:hypothetical protein